VYFESTFTKLEDLLSFQFGPTTQKITCIGKIKKKNYKYFVSIYIYILSDYKSLAYFSVFPHSTNKIKKYPCVCKPMECHRSSRRSSPEVE
jgi:hypothetical protein